jgi:ammonia channel protein AmtB
MKKQIKRVLRILAFGLGAGIVFVTAGAIGGISPLQAGLIGALGAILVVIVAISFEYAAKGSVSDQSFDEAIQTGIQKVKADTDKKK